MDVSRRTFLKRTVIGRAGLTAFGFSLAPVYAQTQGRRGRARRQVVERDDGRATKGRSRICEELREQVAAGRVETLDAAG